MKNPKGKIPSLLSQSTGKPSVHVCKRRASCTRCKAILHMAENCFTIPKVSTGYTRNSIFCLDCVRLIIDQTKKELLVIETTLEAHRNRE